MSWSVFVNKYNMLIENCLLKCKYDYFHKRGKRVGMNFYTGIIR
jgi:hypothetical protein